MTNSERQTLRLLIVVGVIFFAAGTAQGVYGPVLQGIARQTGTDPAVVGGMFTAIFMAGFTGQTLTAIFGKRLQRTHLMAVGLTVSITGFCGIALSTSFPMLLASGVLQGLGFGALLLTGNVAAAEASPRAGPLNLVNAVYGIGAIAGPALVWLSFRKFGVGTPALWAAPAIMSVALVLLLAFRPQAVADPRRVPAPSEAPRGFRAVLRTPVIWVLGSFSLLQISLETGLAAWLPTLLLRSSGLPLETGATFMLIFWSCLTSARLGAAWVSRFLEPLKVLRISVSLCLAGSVLVLLATVQGANWLALAGIGCAGLGVGPNLPSILSIVRKTFPGDATFASGIIFGMNTIGGSVMSLSLGLAMERIGPAAVAGAYVVFATLMIAAFATFARMLRRDPESAAAAA